MNVIDTNISGVKILQPQLFGDSRVYFFESFRLDQIDDLLGTHVEFVQENQSRSHRGVVRGLHFQLPPHAQAKLVRVVEGSVLDVAVDLRRNSTTYGQYVAVELSADNCRQLFIPRGFAHGFAVLSDFATFIYKCDNYYAPQAEGGLMWNDPDINIDWQLPANQIILSDKDLHHPLLHQFSSPF